MAAITSVSQEMHEAAAIDGANRLRRVWSITIPCIMPTIVTMLILRCGSLLSVGFDDPDGLRCELCWMRPGAALADAVDPW